MDVVHNITLGLGINKVKTRSIECHVLNLENIAYIALYEKLHVSRH